MSHRIQWRWPAYGSEIVAEITISENMMEHYAGDPKLFEKHLAEKIFEGVAYYMDNPESGSA